MSASTAIAQVDEPAMHVHSALLGELEVAKEDIIAFPDGLFGFPGESDFVLVASSAEGFYWLQSVEHGSLVFVVADPFLLFDGYSVDLQPADLFVLGATDSAEIAILTIVTLPTQPGDRPTANLQGPLALNLQSGRGKQLALQDSQFGVRCPFDVPLSAD